MVTFHGKADHRQGKEDRRNPDEFVKAAEVMDRPEVIERLFFPRREHPEEARPKNGMSHAIKVAETVSIGCRFYPAAKAGPSLLYFHGKRAGIHDYV